MSDTEFTSFDQAAEALAAAVSGNEATPTGEPTGTPFSPAEPSQPTQPGITQGDQGTPQEPAQTEFLDSKNIDLSQLTDDQRDYLQSREREMQAAFTRKTQELAQERQQAQQAMEFIQELNTNPEFAFEVQARLASELEQLGYSADQAGQIASDQLNQGQYGEVDDPYLAEINDLKAWKAEQEQRIAEAEASSRIDRETAIIQAENPHFSENDMRDIYGLALSFNGNLRAATDAYKSITQRSVERYISQKANVPASLGNQPSATAHAEPAPEQFIDLGDKRLRAAALERLRAEGYE